MDSILDSGMTCLVRVKEDTYAKRAVSNKASVSWLLLKWIPYLHQQKQNDLVETLCLCTYTLHVYCIYFIFILLLSTKVSPPVAMYLSLHCCFACWILLIAFTYMQSISVLGKNKRIQLSYWIISKRSHVICVHTK